MSTIDKASLIQIPSGYKNGKLYSVKPNPTYGSELVTNGDFSGSSTGWTESGTWTYGNNNEVCTGNGTNQVLTQSSILTTGKKYKYSIDIISSTLNSQEIRFYLGGTDYVTYTLNGGAETISAYAEAAGTNLAIRVTSSNTSGVLTIDNVSVKEITNIGDFDFSRSSSATRVNSEGLIETAQVVSTTELVTNGDFATDSDWLLGGSASISNGSANFTGSGDLIRQNTTTPSGTYKVTFTVTGTGYLVVKNYTGGILYREYTNISQGEHTIYIEKNEDGIMFQSFGFASSIDNVSVKEVFENDVPRLDYSGGASCASLLLEPQSTNLVTYSSDFSTYLSANITTTTNNSTSPDGTINANKATPSTANGQHRYTPSYSVTSSTKYAASVFAKKDGYNKIRITENATTGGYADFDLLNGQVLSTSNVDSAIIEDYGDGWYRCIIVETTGSTSFRFDIIVLDDDNNVSFVGDGTSSVLLWGAQLEQGSYATSYIPTSGSTVTRTADVCNNAGTSATFNSTEGVLFAEIAALVDDGTNRILSLSEDGNNNNRVTIFYTSGSNKIKFTVRLNGANEFDETITLSNILDYNKVALKFAENNFAVYINGVKEEEQLSGSIYSANTLDKLSFDKGDGSLDFYGKTKQLMVFDEALSDEELSDLTGQVNLSFNNLATFYGYTIL